MKAPESLETLVDYGIIQQVVRPLMSGKEAHVYVVIAGGEECVAKVYKEAHRRTFKHRSEYTEGRRTRNTRDQRAISKRTQHGRKKDEDAWRSTEVDMIHRLRDAGVRVPEPINYVEGVLVMELVKDADGHAAPRLGDLSFSASEARAIYEQLIREVVRMLSAGVIHGDLSDFNVLMSRDGPVLIDFPQSVDPTHNANSQKLLLRDVENLQRFLARFAPDERRRPHGEEIWSLFQANQLAPDTKLTGRIRVPEGKADIGEVMALVEDAQRDAVRRRGDRDDDDDESESSAERAASAPAPFRKVVDFSSETSKGAAAKKPKRKAATARPARRRRSSSGRATPPAGPAADAVPPSEPAATPRRRRRSRRARPRSGDTGGTGAAETATRAGEPATGAAGGEAGREKSATRSRGRAGAKASGRKTKKKTAAGDGARTGSPRPSRSETAPRSDRASRDRVEGERPPQRRRRRPRKTGSAE